MPRNIEIKARLRSVDELLPRARALADGDVVVIDQHDTFFHVPHGRLKLRAFSDGSAELIHYHRPNTAAPKASDYVRVPVTEARLLHEALARGCGVVGHVRKRRLLLLVGQTRVHLDRVEGLGDFIELEVVLRDGQADDDGRAVAEQLMHRLGLAGAPRLAGAYLDLRRASAD